MVEFPIMKMRIQRLTFQDIEPRKWHYGDKTVKFRFYMFSQYSFCFSLLRSFSSPAASRLLPFPDFISLAAFSLCLFTTPNQYKSTRFPSYISSEKNERLLWFIEFNPSSSESVRVHWVFQQFKIAEDIKFKKCNCCFRSEKSCTQ